MSFAWEFNGQRGEFYCTVFFFPPYLQGREMGWLQHCLTFVGGEDEDDGWALLRLDAFPGWGEACGTPLLCFLVNIHLPGVLLLANTSCLDGSCFKETSKKYVSICWGFPPGYFLNSSSVKRKNTYLLRFCMCTLTFLFSSHPVCCHPTSFTFLSFSFDFGKRTREMGILPLPLIGPLLTVAPVAMSSPKPSIHYTGETTWKSLPFMIQFYKGSL